MSMEILEFGNPEDRKLLLIHGFESPYQIWEEYIRHFSKSFRVIVPVLPGHDPARDEDFESFESCARELEDHCLARYGKKIFAVYGMSMGGVVAAILWENGILEIEKLIMESSPLLGYGPVMSRLLIKQYLSITHKAQVRDRKTVRKAVNSMVTEDKLDSFMALLDHISDTTIENYIRGIGKHRLPDSLNRPETELHYLYGGHMSEFLFRSTARFLRKNYPAANVVCLEGRGHCEDALLHPDRHILTLAEILKPAGAG